MKQSNAVEMAGVESDAKKSFLNVFWFTHSMHAFLATAGTIRVLFEYS